MIGFVFADESEAKVFYKRVQAHKSGNGAAPSRPTTDSPSDLILLQISPNHLRSRRRNQEEVERSISL